MKESLTVSVLRGCRFTCLVVFLWRLLISAECRLQFCCQHWWKEEREREKENCIAAKKEEFVIGRERFQMLEQKHGDWESSCLLTYVFAVGALAAESQTPVQLATVVKNKFQYLDLKKGRCWFDFR